MRIGSHPVRHGLVVLTAIYGICIASPAISQPANDFDVVEATIDSIQAAMRSGGLTCTWRPCPLIRSARVMTAMAIRARWHASPAQSSKR
jgi:hypothetical protein